MLGMAGNDRESRSASQVLRIAGQVCLALVACLLAGPWTRLEPRPRHMAARWSAIGTVLTVTHAGSADVTAGPDVTTPSASVARFSIWPLPIVATIVDIRFLREVALSRIGGLYGP